MYVVSEGIVSSRMPAITGLVVTIDITLSNSSAVRGGGVMIYLSLRLRPVVIMFRIFRI